MVWVAIGYFLKWRIQSSAEDGIWRYLAVSILQFRVMTMQTFVQDSNPNSTGSWTKVRHQRLALGATAATKVGIHCQGVVTWDGSVNSCCGPSSLHLPFWCNQVATGALLGCGALASNMAHGRKEKWEIHRKKGENYGMIILDSPNSYHPIMLQ